MIDIEEETDDILLDICSSPSCTTPEEHAALKQAVRRRFMELILKVRSEKDPAYSAWQQSGLMNYTKEKVKEERNRIISILERMKTGLGTAKDMIEMDPTDEEVALISRRDRTIEEAIAKIIHEQ